MAEPNSSIWLNSGLHLHTRIYRDNPKEAEQLFDSILSSNPSTINELKAWNARQNMAAYQNDDEEVARIGLMMLKRMYSDEAPKELGSERMRFFQKTQSGIYGMMNYWHNKEQSAKIREFGEAYPYEFIQESIERFSRRRDNQDASGARPVLDDQQGAPGSGK